MDNEQAGIIGQYVSQALREIEWERQQNKVQEWRYEFAKAAMQGMLVCESFIVENIPAMAVKQADALLAELEK